MKNLFVTIILIIFTSTAFSQASGSTEFEIEISLLDLPNDAEYEFYSMEMTGINTLSSCYYEIDSLKKNIKFSGNLDYIVGADALTFIITQKTTLGNFSYGKKQVVKHYIVRINRVGSIGGSIKVIKLNSDKPFIEIGAEFKDKELEIYTKYYSNTSEVEYMADIINREWIKVNSRTANNVYSK